MSVHTDRPADVTARPRRSPARPAPGRPRAPTRRAAPASSRATAAWRALTIVVFHVFQYAAAQRPTLNPLLGALARFETVDFLFLMSAYLLTLSYARAAIDGDDPPAGREFLFRRAVRILPLYWIGVTVVWAIRNPALPGDWVDLLEHLHFPQVFDRERIFYTLGPTWSMCLEVMFYGVLVLLGPARGACLLAHRVAAPPGRAAARPGRPLLAVAPFIWNSVAFLALDIPLRQLAGVLRPAGALRCLRGRHAARRDRRRSPGPSAALRCRPGAGALARRGRRARRGGALRPGHLGPGRVPRLRRRRLVPADGQHGAGRPRAAVVPDALLARADLAGPDQLQHLHVARAG